MVGGGQWHVPVEEEEPILAVVCFPAGDDVRERESRGPAVEFLLRFLFLLDFLERKQEGGGKAEIEVKSPIRSGLKQG